MYKIYTPTHVFLSADGTVKFAGHDLHVVCAKPSWNSPSGHSVQVSPAADENVPGGQGTENI
jgi:hypothetical protein